MAVRVLLSYTHSKSHKNTNNSTDNNQYNFNIVEKIDKTELWRGQELIKSSKTSFNSFNLLFEIG